MNESTAGRLKRHLDTNAKEYYAPIITKTNKTNAERLEQILFENESFLKYNDISQLSSSDKKWLIGQAERAQTLEKSVQKAVEMQEYYLITNDELKRENERLREALEEIAKDDGTPEATIARQALEGVSNDQTHKT